MKKKIDWKTEYYMLYVRLMQLVRQAEISFDDNLIHPDDIKQILKDGPDVQ